MQAMIANITAPESGNIKFLAELPAVSPEEQKHRLEMLNKTHLSGQPILQEKAPVGPSGKETDIVNTKFAPLSSSPGTFTIFNNSALGASALSKSTVNEPSVANSGNYVFYTGNWYAARSVDGGSTFSYVNPFADMPTFCCDQDVIYEQSRDIFIWYRQGIQNANGVNYFRLGISNDKGATWVFYNVYPTNINSTWTNQWWDYPQLALSNNYLYIASNIFDQTDSFTRTITLRFPLDDLKNHASLSYNYISDNSHFTFAPAQGATSIMYWGTHHTNSVFRLYSWDESSTSANYYDRTITTWTTTTKGSAICPGPDGYNWCARTDSRVLSGWVANGTIGFFWNVKQGNGFPYPYIEAATFKESDKSYVGRPSIWSPNFAYQYGAAAPDSRGHLGISVFWGGGSYYPSHAVGIVDSYSGAPPPWELMTTNVGTNGPNNTASSDPHGWGDYVRVRSYNPSGLLWIATGYTLQGGSSGSFADPRYIIFGRARDDPFNFTLSISATPTSVTVGVPTSVIFAVTSVGVNISGATVTLNGNATGSGITDTDGNGTISVNATGAGTITATASKTGYTSASTTITANAPAVTPVPSVIGYAPSSPVSDTAGATRTFNITVNQTLNVTWTINGTTVQTNNSVTAASYTNTSAAAGAWNVTATATNINGTATQLWTWVVTGTPAVVSSITPNSRNAQVGTPVTIFMSVINGGTGTATGVSIAQASGLPVTVSYQQWNGTAFTGSPNTSVDIPSGSTANFVLSINATATFNSSSMTFNVSSTNGATAPISGVNTLTISASTVPTADIIMMATGTLDYRTGVGTPTAFAVATSNVGTANATGVSFTVQVPSSITGLAYQVNETNPDGSIKGPATGLTIAVGAQPTFAVFLTPTQPIAYDPANNRIMLELMDVNGKIIGAQSVAVSTT
ncbi:MAG: hypothetical protein ABOK23_01145 [Candidatus Methanoperedens sp.]|nr:hypothetical protein [Candidatus Methanoperedens sp.]